MSGTTVTAPTTRSRRTDLRVVPFPARTHAPKLPLHHLGPLGDKLRLIATIAPGAMVIIEAMVDEILTEPKGGAR